MRLGCLGDCLKVNVQRDGMGDLGLGAHIRLSRVLSLVS